MPDLDPADVGARRIRIVHWEGEDMVVEREAWVPADGAVILANVRPGVSVHVDAPLREEAHA